MNWRSNVLLKHYVTLRAGGPAQRIAECRSADDLESAVRFSHEHGDSITMLGWGSNVLPSDRGISGNTLLNLATELEISKDGSVSVETGCGFQDLFLKTAQAGLRGFEFAVGIPGTVGGALVSNAGAYRSCISEHLVGLEVMVEGKRTRVSPDWMHFSYRDSVLRGTNSLNAILLRAFFKLPHGDSMAIYADAREYQRQRISKQPPSASAGSFFKNVQNESLAESIPGLTDGMRQAGVVPAGFLIEAAGLRGYRHGGAMFGQRHANFILNVRDASATEIRELAEFGKRAVFDRFGVELEEEVLYLGDWS